MKVTVEINLNKATVTKLVTSIICIMAVLWFLGVQLNAPMSFWDEVALAQYGVDPATTIPADPGLAQTNPAFEGVESIYTTPSIWAVNEYGDYALHVNTCYIVDLIGAGGGIWQPDVVRGNPVADLIAVHQGRSIVIYDWTGNDYLEAGNEVNVMSYLNSSDGHMEIFGLDAAYEFRVNEQTATPSTGNTDFVYAFHDGTNGEVGADSDAGVGQGGNLGLRADVGDYVGILDNNGLGDDYYFPNGDGANGEMMITNGANQLAWGLPDGLVERTSAAYIAVDGCTAEDYDTGDAWGGGEDVMAWVRCREENGGAYWNALSHPLPVADMVTYYWFEGADGDLHIKIINDTAIELEAVVYYVKW